MGGEVLQGGCTQAPGANVTARAGGCTVQHEAPLVGFGEASVQQRVECSHFCLERWSRPQRKVRRMAVGWQVELVSRAMQLEVQMGLCLWVEREVVQTAKVEWQQTAVASRKTAADQSGYSQVVA